MRKFKAFTSCSRPEALHFPQQHINDEIIEKTHANITIDT